MAAVSSKGIRDLIRDVCHSVGTSITVPCRLCQQKSLFAIPVALTFCSQGTVIIIAIMTLLDISSDPSGDSSSSSSGIERWLRAAIVFGIIHIAAAIHFGMQVINRNNDLESQDVGTSMQRVRYLWNALYIVALILYCIFLIRGFTILFWTCGYEDCDDENGWIESRLVWGIGCIFLILGCMSLCVV